MAEEMGELLTPEEREVALDDMRERINEVNPSLDDCVYIGSIYQMEKDKAQLAKLLKHRSRPGLRETFKNALVEASKHTTYYWDEHQDQHHKDTQWTDEYAYKVADQLLLLYPDEEEIYEATQQSFENGKREERERIRQEILGGKPKGVTNEKGDMIFPAGQDIPPGHFIYFVSRDGLEALKKGE